MCSAMASFRVSIERQPAFNICIDHVLLLAQQPVLKGKGIELAPLEKPSMCEAAH